MLWRWHESLTSILGFFCFVFSGKCQMRWERAHARATRDPGDPAENIRLLTTPSSVTSLVCSAMRQRHPDGADCYVMDLPTSLPDLDLDFCIGHLHIEYICTFEQHWALSSSKWILLSTRRNSRWASHVDEWNINTRVCWADRWHRHLWLLYLEARCRLVFFFHTAWLLITTVPCLCTPRVPERHTCLTVDFIHSLEPAREVLFSV